MIPYIRWTIWLEKKKVLDTEKPLRTKYLENLVFCVFVFFFASCIFWFDKRSQLSWSATPRREAACLGAMFEAFATSLGWLQLCLGFGAKTLQHHSR